MSNATAYQNKDAEQWRLKTTSARAALLQPASESLLALLGADDPHNAKQAEHVFAHIFQQVTELDEISKLNGATGESNELYHQARGLTIVAATQNSEKLPILVHTLAALLTGNQVYLDCAADKFAGVGEEIQQILASAGVNKNIFTLTTAEEADKNIFADKRLAQVAITGNLAEVQALSAQLSQTQGMLTQLIAITDQQGLGEIFYPEYLHRFCTERVRTINTTAIGGNASLIELGVE